MLANSMDAMLNSGEILNYRYRILHQIKQNSFGRTYLAKDTNRFDEICILKEFAPQLKGEFAVSRAKELFEEKAGILYRLEHPQIPRFRELFHYRSQNKGQLFLVQDYIEGQSYSTIAHNRSQKKIKFSESEVEQLLCQILPVLEYIHSIGLIHGNISPENLILHSSNELVSLTDFGIINKLSTEVESRLVKSVNTSKTETIPSTETIQCSNRYAPPEQEQRGIICPNSDLYALAATAVVLLTGQEPEKLITPYDCEWNWQDRITVSPGLKWVLNRMLAPDSRDRFNYATEVQQALQKSSSATHIGSVSSQSSPSKRKIAPLFVVNKLLSVTLATLTLMVGFWLLQKRDLMVFPFVTESFDLVQAESELQTRLSQGEKVLISKNATLEKELASAAFAEGDYSTSAELLAKSLKAHPNDPEALIYLNNAHIGNNNSHSIAVSVPIGSNINASQEILRGVAQAQNLVNQEGGIDGIPLKVKIINDDNNPEIGKKIARLLTHKPEILGVVGHYASDVTIATTPIYQSGQLVNISPVSTSVQLSNLSPYFFRTVPSDHMAARALAGYMLQNLKEQNVAVFYSSQSNYSQSLKSEFVAAVSLGGGNITNTFDLSDANFSAADSLQQAIDRGAEVIMLAANTGTLDKALQVVQVNRQKLSLLGGDDVYNPKTLQVVGESAKDMVVAIPWHIDSKPESNFVQNSRKLWQADVNWRTATAYDATRVLITAIDRSPSRLGMQKAISNPQFSALGACGQIYFLPSGDRFKAIELVKVEPTSHNSFGYEFTPLFSN